MRGGKTSSKLGYGLMDQKWSALHSGGASPKNKPQFESKFESYQDGRKLSFHASVSSADFRMKGIHWEQHFFGAEVYYFTGIVFISCTVWYSFLFSGSVKEHNFQ